MIDVFGVNETFVRVLLASNGVKFIAKIYLRTFLSDRMLNAIKNFWAKKPKQNKK